SCSLHLTYQRERGARRDFLQCDPELAEEELPAVVGVRDDGARYSRAERAGISVVALAPRSGASRDVRRLGRAVLDCRGRCGE
ncbi:hypothetical protein R6H00_07210, partial [Actinotignum timonense]|uniref:hypothetical protein n=1 Tax=Actinotignum timonense TaxID=1870995 RepID=UPI002A823AD1